MIKKPSSFRVVKGPLEEDLLLKSAQKNLSICLVNHATLNADKEDLTKETKLLFDSLIKTLAITIDARDPLTAGHSERVAEYAHLIGKTMNLSETDMEMLKYASLLHDIGKIGVCETILLKEGRLTVREFRIMQKHAFCTYEILKNIHFDACLQEIPAIASSHHERMDGTGYYQGLRGDDIPLLSRILAVADVFDAITSHRHYRDRMPFEKAIKTIEEESGNHFDTNCVESFMKVKLLDLSRVLLKQHGAPGEQYDEAGQSLLRKLDKNITLAEYLTVLRDKGKAMTDCPAHTVFNTLYNHCVVEE